MQKFILKLIAVVAPVVALVVSVNYFGDAALLFSSQYEHKIAQMIISGSNVTNVSNFNERLLQKSIITNLASCPKVLVLGSSRTMLIHSTNFNQGNFFNSSVSGASIEDIVAIWEMYEEKKCLPSKVILGLDPWTLNANSTQDRWLTIKQEYYAGLKRIAQINKKPTYEWIDNKYWQLFSPSYFKSSLSHLQINSEPQATTHNLNQTLTRLTDGSITYSADYRNVSASDVNKRVADYLSGDIYSLYQFEELSPEIKNVLEKFIQHLKNKNIEVLILLAPYHPNVYSVIKTSPKYSQVMEGEKYFINLRNKYDLKLIGSFNPALANMDSSAFYDGMHCNEKGLQILLSSIK